MRTGCHQQYLWLLALGSHEKFRHCATWKWCSLEHLNCLFEPWPPASAFDSQKPSLTILWSALLTSLVLSPDISAVSRADIHSLPDCRIAAKLSCEVLPFFSPSPSVAHDLIKTSQEPRQVAPWIHQLLWRQASQSFTRKPSIDDFNYVHDPPYKRNRNQGPHAIN